MPRPLSLISPAQAACTFLTVSKTIAMRTIFLLFLGSGWLTLAAQTIPLPPDGLKSQISYTVEDITCSAGYLLGTWLGW